MPGVGVGWGGGGRQKENRVFLYAFPKIPSHILNQVGTVIKHPAIEEHAYL